MLAFALACPAFCMPAWAAQPLADQLATMLAAGKPVDAAALLDSAKAELLDGDAVETADDIAQEWSTGTLALERGGVYRLSENVETATTLKVSAPEHEAIVIDLAGCSVAGTGGLSTLIQVTDESKGTVAIVDSSLWLAERDHDPDTLVPASTLSLRLDGAADGAQVISVAKLSGLKPGEKRTAPALILSNIGLDLSFGERGSAKAAACLAVEDGPVVLADAFAARAAGDACGIASSTEDAFELLPGFNPDGTLTAELTGSKAAVLAHAAKGWDAEKAKALVFANAGAAGGSYAFDGGALFTLQTPAVTEALQDQGGTDAGAPSTGASRGMSAMALEGTDIAAAWGKLGTDKVFTVSEGGSYYLGSDLKTSARLYINAPGEDVVLDFGGHTLTVDDTSSTGMGLAIGSAASVTLKGDAERKSTLFMNSSYIYYGIMCNQADELKVEGLTVKVRSNDDSLSLKYLKSYGIYMNKGALTVDNSAVTVDLSNQANTATSGNSSVENGPKAIFIEPGAGAASLKDSTFTVFNSNVVTVRDDSSLLNTGFAQGIWADGTAGVKVEGCSFDVSSPLGTAIGLYGRNLALSGSNSITTHAALYSTSLYAPSTGAIHLGGTLSTSFDAASAKHEVDLYSAASGGFVFDEGFAASGLSAWTGTDEASACGDGSVIASFAAAMGASARDALASKVVNAKGADAACDVARDGDTLRFELAESRAVAVVTHVGEDTPYASVADAIAAAKSGDIVRLLADCAQIKVARGAAGETFAIDLAGHEAASIVAASPADITVFSSQAAAAVVSCDAATFAAVTHSGTGHLALEGITVRASSSNSKLMGVYVSGSGTLSLDGVDIHAVAGVSEACGIRLDGSAGNLSVANSSLSATAAATGVAAYGIVSSSTKNTLSIGASPITVAGTTAYIRGVEHRSTLELSGTPGTTSIAVQASGASTSAYGVNVPTSAASTTLTDCSIEAASSAATQLWCLGMGSAASSKAPDWTLKGATSLSSSNNTEVAANAGKLSFGADFTNSGDIIHLNTRNLAGDSFGTVAEGAAVDAAELVPAAGSDYDGYSAALVAGIGLVWLHTPVARIGETLFSSLDGAVSAAQAGDVIQVVDDFTLSKAVKISREITIDLAGHHATIAAGAKGSGGSNKAGGALVYNAAGTFAVVDSVGGGKIDISVGSPTETSNTAANGYQGIAVTGGGTLSMSGVEVGVAYAGSCPAATKPLMNLYGVYLKDGAAKLSDGATLKVVGAPEDGSFGATRAYGIYAAASDASIAVDESSRVEVVSNAANTVLSYMDYPGVGSSSGAQSSSNAYLMEITPEEGSELYEMVQETFRTKASFDSAIDQKGYVYGTQIYYVTSQALDNKVSIWAYSDPVTGEDVGKADSIKATHIYIRSDYARPNYAYGIASADSFAGTATIAGAVSAQTAAGAAYGIYENEAGAWSVDEDKAVATATAATYKSAATSKMDLASIIDFDDKSLKDIKYPKNSGFYLVSEVKSVADSVHKPGEAYDTSVVSSSTEQPEPGDGDVTVSFGAYDRTKTYEGLSCGQTIALPGSDFTGREPSFNATYTFLGWSKRAGATSIDEAAGDIPASATTMAVDGDAGYYAVYRTLGDKLPITFTGMHEADGSGAPDITVRIPGGTTLKDSGAQQVTPADYSADGVTYRFVGWNVSCVDLTVYSYDPASLYEDFTFAADNTSATCTAVYVPVAPGQHLVTFKVQHGVAAYAVDDGISPNFEACYNSNDVCVPALIETTSGYTATYKGWSAGYDRSNKYDEGMQCYTGPLPKADADVTYTARYDYSVTKRTMNFYTYKEAVEGGYAYAGTKVERVDWTLDGIIEANKIVKPGDTFDYERRTYTFLGWSTRLSDKEPLYTDTLLVNSTPSSDGATSFFGIYSIGTRTITVNYYDHGELYAQATKQIPEASIGSALHSTGLEPPTPANPAGQFRGWSTEEGAASTLTDATQLSELSGDEDVVNLYAVYYEGGAMVRFYDDDHKTLLYDVEVKRGYTVDAYAHETNESILAKVGMKRDLFRAWVTEDGQIFSLTDTQVVGDFDVFATYVQESAGTGKADTSGIKIDVGGFGGVRVNVNTARLASAASAASGAASAAADAAETAEATVASVDASGIGGDGDGMAAGAEASPVAGEIGSIIFFAVLVALLIAAIAGLLLFFLKRRKKDEEEAVSFVPAELESIRF